jgi:hypothetical protein
MRVGVKFCEQVILELFIQKCDFMAERNALGPSMGLRDSDAIRHTLQFRYLRDSRERHILQKTGGRLFAKEIV